MVDEDVEGGDVIRVVGGTCASQKWPCRLPEKARRQCSK
jgi:hypothetical protein